LGLKHIGVKIHLIVSGVVYFNFVVHIAMCTDPWPQERTTNIRLSKSVDMRRSRCVSGSVGSDVNPKISRPVTFQTAATYHPLHLEQSHSFKVYRRRSENVDITTQL